jgi:hypothetical protein
MNISPLSNPNAHKKASANSNPQRARTQTHGKEHGADHVTQDGHFFIIIIVITYIGALASVHPFPILRGTIDLMRLRTGSPAGQALCQLGSQVVRSSAQTTLYALTLKIDRQQRARAQLPMDLCLVDLYDILRSYVPRSLFFAPFSHSTPAIPAHFHLLLSLKRGDTRAPCVLADSQSKPVTAAGNGRAGGMRPEQHTRPVGQQGASRLFVVSARTNKRHHHLRARERERVRVWTERKPFLGTIASRGPWRVK